MNSSAWTPTLIYYISLGWKVALEYVVPLKKITNLYLFQTAAQAYHPVRLCYPPYNTELQFSNMSSLAPYALTSIYKHRDSKMFFYSYTLSSNHLTKQKFSWVNFCKKRSQIASKERKKLELTSALLEVSERLLLSWLLLCSKNMTVCTLLSSRDFSQYRKLIMQQNSQILISSRENINMRSFSTKSVSWWATPWIRSIEF